MIKTSCEGTNDDSMEGGRLAALRYLVAQDQRCGVRRMEGQFGRRIGLAGVSLSPRLVGHDRSGGRFGCRSCGAGDYESVAATTSSCGLAAATFVWYRDHIPARCIVGARAAIRGRLTTHFPARCIVGARAAIRGRLTTTFSRAVHRRRACGDSWSPDDHIFPRARLLDRRGNSWSRSPWSCSPDRIPGRSRGARRVARSCRWEERYAFPSAGRSDRHGDSCRSASVAGPSRGQPPSSRSRARRNARSPAIPR